MIDGLERLATGARDAVMDALNALAGLPFVRLIVTARPDTWLPETASTPHALAPAPREKVAQYLEQRAVAQPVNWTDPPLELCTLYRVPTSYCCQREV